MSEIDQLIRVLARLPGLGPRSARRAALHMIQRRDSLMQPLAEAVRRAAETIRTCEICGNLDTRTPCTLCTDPRRDDSVLCVVEQVGDLWALERANVFRGRYHVLGGVLSALEGIGPDDLNLSSLIVRARPENGVTEVVLATNLTVDGQTTAHYVMDRLAENSVKVTRLAHGIPAGGELDWLDDGTLGAAFHSRQRLGEE